MNIPYIEMFPLVWGIISARRVNLLECVQPVGRKAKIWLYFPPHFFKWFCKPCLKKKKRYLFNGWWRWVMWNKTERLKCCISTVWGSFQLWALENLALCSSPENKITEKKCSPLLNWSCVCVCVSSSVVSDFLPPLLEVWY